jgi:trimethylamine--corrinoid protein Co-methyltransferase
MVPFVGGSFDSLVFSPELVVYADDLIHQSRQFASGFSLEDEVVGLSDIATTGPGGSFFTSRLTETLFRDSQFTSTIWPFLSLDKWKAQGKPAAKILNERTLDLLNHPVTPQDKDSLLAKGEAFLTA